MKLTTRGVFGGIGMLCALALAEAAGCSAESPAGSASAESAEPVGQAAEAVSAACAHELTCSGGPLANGTTSSGGCIPASGNANGYCVHEVCADSAHAYCCTSTWDNGCAQFAATFTKAAGFTYNDCPTPTQNPVAACTSGCTPKTCSTALATCGSVSDGCGGTLNCGVCPSGQTCTNNMCGAGTTSGPVTCAHDLTCTDVALVKGCDSGSNMAGCVTAICGYSGTTHCCTSFGSAATWDAACVAELHYHTQCKIPNPPASPQACGTGSSSGPALCMAANANCGTIPDGNGGTVNCGTCTAPQTCGGGGTANQCGCTTQTCPAGNPGDTCGTIPNGCGGALNCGCAAGDTCSATSSGTCQSVCVPLACGSGGVGSACGTVSNGCGGTLTCSCPAGETCTNGTCQAGSGCTPTTCAAQGKNCGAIADGCGGTLSCGSCAVNAACTNNVCVTQTCTPNTCPTNSCGTIADGCGGTLNCGTCPSGETCSPSNVCQPAMGTITLPSPTLPPVKMATLTFGMIGDTRPSSSTTGEYPQSVKNIIAAAFAGMQAQKLPFAVGTGDYAYSSTSAGSALPQYMDYMAARKTFAGTFLPTMGNHECNGFTDSNCPVGSFTGMTTDYVNTIVTPSTGQSNPYLSALYEATDGSWSAKFIFVAANAWNSTQQTWLQATLAVPTTYTFVIRHEPANANTAPGTTPSETLLASAFKGGTLTLSITGHTHLVQLPGGTQPYGDSFGSTEAYEIIVGVGGAPLDAGSYYGFGVATRRASDGAIVTQMYESANSSGTAIVPNVADTKFRFAVNANGTSNTSTTLP
ncbi:MAG TPA: metallophosphoesterase [Polyangiaceae bacterium]|nr:metallophosphoesterase [Polyangiaceae bacterium]